MKMAYHLYINDLIAKLDQLEETLEWKVNDFQTIIKISRTCLQGALSMTFGQKFKVYLTFIKTKEGIVKLTTRLLKYSNWYYCCLRRHIKLILQLKK